MEERRFPYVSHGAGFGSFGASRSVTAEMATAFRQRRKCYIGTDTQGWTWAVGVQAANEYESRHALELLKRVERRSSRLEAVFADKAYRGGLEDELSEALRLQLEVAESDSGESGFPAEPKRWVVERTLGWLGGCRRLSKKYERLTKTRAAMVRLASLRLAFSRF